MNHFYLWNVLKAFLTLHFTNFCTKNCFPSLSIFFLLSLFLFLSFSLSFSLFLSLSLSLSVFLSVFLSFSFSLSLFFFLSFSLSFSVFISFLRLIIFRERLLSAKNLSYLFGRDLNFFIENQVLRMPRVEVVDKDESSPLTIGRQAVWPDWAIYWTLGNFDNN